MSKTEWITFEDIDGKWMICKKCQSEYVQISDNVVSVVCSMCVQRLCLAHTPLEEMSPSLKKKETSGRPPGWHFMKEFIDKDGTVFHKGVEQPDLKGSLKPTKSKPRKKKKKLTADEKLFKLAEKYKKKRKK